MKGGGKMADNSSKIAGAFLLGGLLGAFIASLYAPKAGKETRDDIALAANRMKDNMADIADDTVNRVHEFAEDVKNRAESIIGKGSDLSAGAREKVLKAFEYGQKALEEQKKKIAEKVGL
ncbi:MAG TPA: YtxH domain-containing protein [Nitrospirae bacterium]|nr:YtxH domain-containing protein [Nitrospirota bacterium]